MIVIDSPTFLHENWLWPIVLISVVLCIIFLWKDAAYTTKSQRFLRACASLIAIICLSALFLEPLVARQEARATGIVLTENYKPSQRDSLKQVHRGLKEIFYKENIVIEKNLDSLQTIYLLGDGIAPYDLWQFNNRDAIFLGGKPLSGLIRLHYNKDLVLGDSLSVSGSYANVPAGHQIVLQDQNGVGKDSITFSKERRVSFQLNIKPKVVGNYLYQLIERDSLNRQVSVSPLPIVIDEKKSLNILIVNTYPTFETKYLKNFLAEDGHKILVRSELTKGKYKFESFNRDRGTIYDFTGTNLSDFDIVILDVDSYRKLSQGSKRAVINRVEEAGLGVLLQADPSLINQGDIFGFRLERNKTNHIRFNRWPAITVATYPFTFVPNSFIQPILTAEGQIISAYAQRGIGKIGALLVQDSYQLLLEGNAEVYAYLWSKTVESISQRSRSVAAWEVQDFMIFPDEPLRFQVRTSIPRPKVVDENGTALPLSQDVTFPDTWEGMLYPQSPGWKSLRLEQDSLAVTHFYVAPQDTWKDARRYAHKMANQRHFQSSDRTTAYHTALTPLNRWWFFIFFVLAIGYLWIAPRLGNKKKVQI